MRPSSRTRSLPGVGCTCIPAPSAVNRAVDERRGSTTISPPAARAPSRWPMNGGIVSATFEPRSRIVRASSRASTGNGRPRSMPKARITGCRRRRHAEPTVVVDARRSQRDAGELSELVGLLVRQPTTAEHSDGVGAVGRTKSAKPVRHEVERFGPARGTEVTVRLTDHRFEQCGRATRSVRRPSSPSCTGPHDSSETLDRRSPPRSGKTAVTVIAH